MSDLAALYWTNGQVPALDRFQDTFRPSVTPSLAGRERSR
jgi:hypothetical protein